MTDKEKEAIDTLFHLEHINGYVDLYKEHDVIIKSDVLLKWKNATKTVLNLIQTQQEEIEKKDNKLKDIKNHIKAELKMIDKLYNEVGWEGKEQYDGMKAAYKCVLNIYFENEVETEDK